MQSTLKPKATRQWIRTNIVWPLWSWPDPSPAPGRARFPLPFAAPRMETSFPVSCHDGLRRPVFRRRRPAPASDVVSPAAAVVVRGLWDGERLGFRAPAACRQCSLGKRPPSVRIGRGAEFNAALTARGAAGNMAFGVGGVALGPDTMAYTSQQNASAGTGWTAASPFGRSLCLPAEPHGSIGCAGAALPV